MTPNDTVSSDDKTEGKGRLGGFLLTLISFAIGAALGAATALMPAQWVAAILLMKAEQATVLDTLDARVALIVAVAALAAFVGVALDVLHTAESAGVNLFVRCTALVAGSTALIGALIAIHEPYKIRSTSRPSVS